MTPPTADRTTPSEITAKAIASFEGCADPRLRRLMQAFVSHLHAFATEVALGEDEWRALIDALTATGRITGERRQEFILWSDALGLRGRYRTRDDGSFAFVAVRPVAYPIPDDGPVGRMLTATGRHPWRPAHLHLIVRADRFRTVATHIFDSASDYLDSDAVFAVKRSLVRSFVERSRADPGRPDGIEGPWVSLELELVLAPGADTGDVLDAGRTG